MSLSSHRWGSTHQETEEAERFSEIGLFVWERTDEYQQVSRQAVQEQVSTVFKLNHE